MKLVIDLPEDQTAGLRASAERLGVSVEEYARLVIERDLRAQERPRPKMRHISEVMAEIMAGVPSGPAE